ncbi:MAG: 3-deoxy-manno-octulosonate cytidylyltransferase (CMP-KDO synthetase) [Arenicella sp.]|jgi:3-deoxy-manno-octulosonate cytidylyltransferase (CMP-KDO synthetase)
MKVLGIIPARYASSRFPGKPLIDIAGKSMIQRVYEQASKSEMISEVVVATDDQRIFDHVTSFEGKVMMTSENHSNGTERCGEVIQEYIDADVVINIQGDEPLIKPEQLDRVLSLFEDDSVQIGTLAKKITDQDSIQNENRVKVVFDKNHEALYFSRSVIPFQKGGNVAEYYKHIGIYAWRLSTLKELLKLTPTELELSESLEQLRWMQNGYRIRIAETSFETPNIDTPEDLDEVLNVLND